MLDPSAEPQRTHPVAPKTRRDQGGASPIELFCRKVGPAPLHHHGMPRMVSEKKREAFYYMLLKHLDASDLSQERFDTFTNHPDCGQIGIPNELQFTKF